MEAELNDIEAPPLITLKPRLSVPLVAALLQKLYQKADIARYFNTSYQAVDQYIDRHIDELEPFLDFDNVLSAEFKLKALKIIKSVDDKDIQKANLRDKLISAGVAVDKFRLIDGESTENVSVTHLSGSLEEIRKQRQLLEERIKALLPVKKPITIETECKDITPESVP